ncbi:MAG: hypothetical protein GC203_09900 [Phenylobacterium sp.]|uniref:hypothetical protein n=1 Tax=Phenylobacterium sp. TaxID=1871053 RepID=UPI0025E9CC8E|nr:hypothetical protein [Phenylobacterium sp.]MBI1198163.1 hypothetical protein [Phenylobacterium sp.]
METPFLHDNLVAEAGSGVLVARTAVAIAKAAIKRMYGGLLHSAYRGNLNGQWVRAPDHRSFAISSRARSFARFSVSP